MQEQLDPGVLTENNPILNHFAESVDAPREAILFPPRAQVLVVWTDHPSPMLGSGHAYSSGNHPPPHACLLVEIRSRRGPAPPCPFYSLPRTGLMVGHGGSSGPDPLGLLLPEEKLRGGSGRCKQQDGSKDKRPWKPAQNQHSCTRARKTRDKMKEKEREREKERRDRERKLYRVLLLVRWRRRERQIVSGLRRKNTEHTHTHTHT